MLTQYGKVVRLVKPTRRSLSHTLSLTASPDELLRAQIAGGDLDAAAATLLQFSTTRPIPISSLHLVFSSLSNCDHFHSAITLYNSLSKSPAFTPDLITFNIVLKCYSLARRSDLAHCLFDEMRFRNIKPDTVSFNTLVKCFCNENNIPASLEVLRTMKDRGLRPNGFTYSMLIGLVSRGCSNSELGLGLIQEMLTLGLIPSTVNWNCVLAALCKDGKVVAARAVYAMVGKSGAVVDITAYTCFVQLLCRERMVGEAKKVFDEMSEKGVHPNVVTHNTLLHGLCLNKHLEDAIRMVNQMIVNGPSPSVVTYTTLMGCLCGEGRLEEALGFMDQMTRQGLEPDKSMYSIMLGALCNRGRTEDAVQLFREMGVCGFNDIVAYNILIRGFCKSGNMDRARELFDEFVGKGLKPDVIMYTSLMDGFCRNAEMDAAKELFNDMQGKGLKPDIITYSTMIEGFCTLGKLDEAQELLFDMEGRNLQPNKVIYTLLIIAFYRAGNLDQAAYYLGEMVDQGQQLNDKTCRLVLDKMSSMGVHQDACNLLNSVVENELGADQMILSEILNHYCKNRRMQEAADFIRRMSEKGGQSCIVSSNSRMQGHCIKGEIVEAANVLHEIVKNGILPSTLGVSLFLDHVCSFGQLDRFLGALPILLGEPDNSGS
ncbi:hypothetical protein J5N97_011481 [Dioscorea zingiberensis]|uniref:Pentatricopeptide repeat-containing protein n=1 Tax=Dioscorea zingiberensis TaxID=325984 RepID=A0A9D5D0P8_9LILI|nr:hypothetical protein J5N97_011481 [Dioscorea zingiberensis]